MTAAQVAAALGVHEKTVRRAIADGRLAAAKNGRGWDIDIDAARSIIGTGGRAVSPYRDALAEALHLLRAFDHDDDARALEERHGIVYVEPRASVHLAEIA